MSPKSKTRSKSTGAEITAHIDTVILAPATRLDDLAKRLVANITQLETVAGAPPTEPLLDEAMASDSDLDALAEKLAVVVTDNATARARAEQNRVTADAMRKTAHTIHARAGQARGEAHGAVIEYLGTELQAVADDVRALAESHPNLIRLDQVQADPTLIGPSQEQGRVLGVYKAIRAAQRSAYKRAAISTGSAWVHMIARSGLLRDAIDHEAHWTLERRRIGGSRGLLAQYAGGSFTAAADWYKNPPAVPWPDTKTAADHAGDDLWTWLTWAVEHAELWVPTFGELEDADANNQSMLSQPPVARPRGRTAGRRTSGRQPTATRPARTQPAATTE